VTARYILSLPWRCLCFVVWVALMLASGGDETV